MNCQDYQDLIVIRIYGELSGEQERTLQSHIRECPECSRMAERFVEHSAILSHTEPDSHPDWDASWRTISEKSFRKPGKDRRALLRLPRPVWVAASVAAVFILGFFAGKQFVFRGPGASSTDLAALDRADSPYVQYADDLEPLLIGFLNRRDTTYRPEAEQLRRIERLLIQDMLLQTRLMKQSADLHADLKMLEFLEDLELILLGMANLRAGDGESLEHLQQIIRDKNLKFKLRSLSQSGALL
jgi:hypothetical protein